MNMNIWIWICSVRCLSLRTRKDIITVSTWYVYV